MFSKSLVLGALALGVSAFPAPSGPIFNNVTIFSPPTTWENQATSYARTVLLNQNCEQGEPTLLASFTWGDPNGPSFPIFKSTNAGESWEQISTVHFTERNYTGGIFLQPFLYELPQKFGAYPAGTILITGNGIPGTFDSTNIPLYASSDKGYTWEFVSTVATGAGPNTTNGAHPIWEPFILAYDNTLSVFYSDQRDPLHGQDLVHQSSTDLKSWGSVVNDVAYGNYTERPGMITMAQVGNGQWITTFELAFPQEDAINSPYAVHYKLASSPLEFGAAEPMLLRPQGVDNAHLPSAGPYVVWTPAGGVNGTVVVSDSTYDELYLNTANGDPSAWQKVGSQGHGVGYTRNLRVMPGNGGKTVLLTNGGMYGMNVTEATTGDFIVPGPGVPNFNAFASCASKGHWGGGHGHGGGPHGHGGW